MSGRSGPEVRHRVGRAPVPGDRCCVPALTEFAGTDAAGPSIPSEPLRYSVCQVMAGDVRGVSGCVTGPGAARDADIRATCRAVHAQLEWDFLVWPACAACLSDDGHRGAPVAPTTGVLGRASLAGAPARRATDVLVQADTLIGCSCPYPVVPGILPAQIGAFAGVNPGRE